MSHTNTTTKPAEKWFEICTELLVRLQHVTCSCLALTLFAGFLSWFRNGLLATGIGVIAFVQSEVGREAGYGTGSSTWA